MGPSFNTFFSIFKDKHKPIPLSSDDCCLEVSKNKMKEMMKGGVISIRIYMLWNNREKVIYEKYKESWG